MTKLQFIRNFQGRPIPKKQRLEVFLNLSLMMIYRVGKGITPNIRGGKKRFDVATVLFYSFVCTILVCERHFCSPPDNLKKLSDCSLPDILKIELYFFYFVLIGCLYITCTSIRIWCDPPPHPIDHHLHH